MTKTLKILRWLNLALVLALGVMLIWRCLSLYASGDNPYTPESVTAALRPAIYLVVAIIGISIACAILSKKARIKPTYSKSPAEYRLKMLKRRTEELSEKVKAIENKKRLVTIVSLAMICLICVYPIIYLLNRNNFATLSFEQMLMGTLKHTLPFVFAALLVCGGALYAINRLNEQQISALTPAKRVPDKGAKLRSGKHLIYARLALLILAIGLITAGVLNGGMNDVLKKAQAICMECIGLLG